MDNHITTLTVLVKIPIPLLIPWDVLGFYQTSIMEVFWKQIAAFKRYLFIADVW